jgi:hypothetical protein
VLKDLLVFKVILVFKGLLDHKVILGIMEMTVE